MTKGCEMRVDLGEIVCDFNGFLVVGFQSQVVERALSGSLFQESFLKPKKREALLGLLSHLTFVGSGRGVPFSRELLFRLCIEFFVHFCLTLRHT